MEPSTWPATREPTASITLDLYAFAQIAAPDERTLFLDFQHPTYSGSPLPHGYRSGDGTDSPSEPTRQRPPGDGFPHSERDS